MGNMTGKEDAPNELGPSISPETSAVMKKAAPTAHAGESPEHDDDGAPDEDDPVHTLARLFGDKGGVPMVFRWEGGGEEVFLTGTFNQWAAKIPMVRSGNDFVHIHELSQSKHAYKFIVDDEWRFMPDQHTMADKGGNINNFVDLSDFKPKFENLMGLSAELLSSMSSKRHLDESLYGNRIPDINDYTKEPPQLPPHLKSIVLNYREGTVPLFVTLDHLHCTARKDGLMVLGMSQRFRQKFFTVVYYSPVQGGGYQVKPSSSRSHSATSGAAPPTQPQPVSALRKPSQ